MGGNGGFQVRMSESQRDPWLNSRIPQDIPTAWLYQSRPLGTQQNGSPLIDIAKQDTKAPERGRVTKLLSTSQPGCLVGSGSSHHLDEVVHIRSHKNRTTGNRNRQQDVRASKETLQDYHRSDAPRRPSLPGPSSKFSGLKKSLTRSSSQTQMRSERVTDNHPPTFKPLAYDPRKYLNSSSLNANSATPILLGKKSAYHRRQDHKPDEENILRSSWSFPALDAIYSIQPRSPQKAPSAPSANNNLHTAIKLRNHLDHTSTKPRGAVRDQILLPSTEALEFQGISPKEREAQSHGPRRLNSLRDPQLAKEGSSVQAEPGTKRAKGRHNDENRSSTSGKARKQRVYVPERAPGLADQETNSDHQDVSRSVTMTSNHYSSYSVSNLPNSADRGLPKSDHQRSVTSDSSLNEADLARESVLSLSGSDDDDANLFCPIDSQNQWKPEEDTSGVAGADAGLEGFVQVKMKGRIPKIEITRAVGSQQVPARSSSRNAYGTETAPRPDKGPILDGEADERMSRKKTSSAHPDTMVASNMNGLKKEAALARLKRDLDHRPMKSLEENDMVYVSTKEDTGPQQRKASALARLKKDMASRPVVPPPAAEANDLYLPAESQEVLMEVTQQEAALLKAMRRTRLAVQTRNNFELKDSEFKSTVRQNPLDGSAVPRDHGPAHQFSQSYPSSEEPSSPRIPPTLASVSTATTVLPYGASSSSHPANRRAHMAEEGKREASVRKASQVLGLDDMRIGAGFTPGMLKKEVISMYMIDENDSGTLGSYEGSAEMLVMR